MKRSELSLSWMSSFLKYQRENWIMDFWWHQPSPVHLQTTHRVHQDGGVDTLWYCVESIMMTFISLLIQWWWKKSTLYVKSFLCLFVMDRPNAHINPPAWQHWHLVGIKEAWLKSTAYSHPYDCQCRRWINLCYKVNIQVRIYTESLLTV